MKWTGAIGPTEETFPRVPLRSPALAAPDQGGGPAGRSHGPRGPTRRRAHRRTSGCDARLDGSDADGSAMERRVRFTMVLPWFYHGFTMVLP